MEELSNMDRIAFTNIKVGFKCFIKIAFGLGGVFRASTELKESHSCKVLPPVSTSRVSAKSSSRLK